MEKSHLPPLPNPPRPLPLVPGPTLDPFTRTARAVIHFVEELGNPDQDQDGRVWKVKIGGKQQEYALKMFNFNDTEHLVNHSAGDFTRDLASPQLYTDYFDPFSCECRPYGRLKQENREDLAIRAHGYVLLTQQQEAEVEKKATGVTHPEQASWNFWGRAPEHRCLPVRAIVKDLVRPQDPFSPEHVSGMWSDLEDLHRLGIIVRDINVFNYLGGKLIDFSRAWTTPHPFPAAMDSYDVKKTRKSDPMNLHKALIEWGMERCWDWDVIPEELIKCAAGMGTNGRYGTNPSRYDWRKWEKDPAAADRFMEHQLFAKLKNADQALEPDHQEASTAVEHSSQ